jgi:hypothetical protein
MVGRADPGKVAYRNGIARTGGVIGHTNRSRWHAVRFQTCAITWIVTLDDSTVMLATLASYAGCAKISGARQRSLHWTDQRLSIIVVTLLPDVALFTKVLLYR